MVGTSQGVDCHDYPAGLPASDICILADFTSVPGWSMNHEQRIQTWAAKLPTPEADRFSDLLREANRFAAVAAEKRSEAWAIYHQIIPPKKQNRRGGAA